MKTLVCAVGPTVSVSMIGEVLGHEQQVYALMQEQVLALGVDVRLVPKHEPADITICFHRLIERISPRELKAFAAHVSGKLMLCSSYGMSEHSMVGFVSETQVC